MSESCIERPLSELATITMGQSPESSCINTTERGLPFLQGCAEFGERVPIAKLHCFPPLRIAKSSSVLISVRAPVGTTNFADQDYCIGRGLGAVSAKQHMADNIFLLHAIERNVGFLHRRSQGSTFLAIGSKELLALPVLSLPLGTQRHIAEILSTVDEAIEQTEALIAKYQQIKAGLMHDLFTRGLTPDGHLRPTYEQAPHLYKESPLGWIPKEWEVEPLRHFVPTVVYGVSVSMSEDPAGVPVLRMNNIEQGRIDVTDLKFSQSLEVRSLLLKPGDVLFNRTNSLDHVGKTAIWRSELPVASFASYLVRLDVDRYKMRSLFLTSWLNLPSTQLGIRRFATPGVHQVNINPTNLRRMECAAPNDLAEQDLITDRIEQLETFVSSNEQRLAKLRQQKHGLMQDLLTGRVRVKGVESQELSA